MRVQASMSVTSAAPSSAHVGQVAAMFGLGVERDRHVCVLPHTQIPLRPGEIVFVTGPSGGGKSTLLRLIGRALRAEGRKEAAAQGGSARQVVARVVDHDGALPRIVDFAQIQVGGQRALVDCFDAPLKDVLRWLSLCGLNDAFVMLRRPGELSDGQRLRLARVMQEVESVAWPGLGDQTPAAVVLADEFGATLDRHVAKVVARQLRKWTSRSRACFVAATTHDDLLEALEPNVLVVKGMCESVEVIER